MYREELKKIWKKETVMLIVLISAVYFFTLLLPPLRMLDHEDDSLAMERAIAEEWMAEYGSDIDPEEYRNIRSHYQDILKSAGDAICESPVFAQCQVSSYEEYESYAQNAINGKEGYSYEKYREMRDALSERMTYDPIYLEVYQRNLVNYEKDVESERYRLSVYADSEKRENFLRERLEKYMREDGNGSLLSEVVLSSATEFLCRIGILCTILTAVLASPVMVNDRMSHMLPLQMSGKCGRKIYNKQLMCMYFSVSICTAIILLIGVAVLGKMGVFQYADCKLFSFSTTGIPLFNLAFGRYAFVLLMLVFMTSLGLGGIFFFLSARSDTTISMLMKLVPVFVMGVIYLGSLNQMFFYYNPIYRLTGIRGIEVFPAILFLGVGYGCNAVHRKRAGIHLFLIY